MTQTGQNEGGVFSPDGTKILLISKDRLNHRQRQLYEMDLITRSERRLTFQDGEVIEAVYSPQDGHIFYTSTTDEIKEHPKLFYPELDRSPFPRTEIYRIKADGEIHERWTEFVGFDGFIHAHEDTNKKRVITASRLINGELQLIRSPLASSKFEIELAKPGYWLHSFSTHPRKLVRAWVEENTTSRASRLVVNARNSVSKSLVTGFFEIRNLRIWDRKDERGISSSKTEDEGVQLLLTAKLKPEANRMAFWVNPAKNCYHVLDLGPGEINSLDLSADGKKILWTLSQSEQSQIFVDDLKTPENLCEPL